MSETAFERLLDTCRKIDSVKSDIKVARRLPEARVADAQRISLGDNGYYSRVDEKIMERAKAAMNDFIQHERQRACIERDKALRKAALDLLALRDLLPQLAAQASIELGALARDLSIEATAQR